MSDEFNDSDLERKKSNFPNPVSDVNSVYNENVGEKYSGWIDNNGNEVEDVFGFTQNAELVNGRAAMFGFLMLILTELVFGLEPVTKSLFGIG